MVKKKKYIILVSIGLVILIGFIGFSRSRYGVALFRSKKHFIQYSKDSIIFYEPGAENAAEKFAAFLPDAIKKVEEVHGLPFKREFKIYVCATQESHNTYVAAPSHWPIRGTSLMGNVLTAPSAFSFRQLDTHRETLMHELSHLHLFQRLGYFGYKKVPFWFTEGIANHLAGSGGEGISDSLAIQYISNGRHFHLKERGGLTKSILKVVASSGLKFPMFHRQNKMFVKFISTMNSTALKELLLDIQNGEDFSASFSRHFSKDAKGVWEEFEKEMNTQHSTRNDQHPSEYP